MVLLVKKSYDYLGSSTTVWCVMWGGRRFEPLIKRERTATYVLLPMVLCDLFYMDDIRHGLKLNSKTFFDI